MSKVRLNLSDLSIPEKIAKAQQVVTALTANPNFPVPTPALANITSAANDLKTAADDVQATRQLGKEKTAIQNQKEAVLDQLLAQSGSYVAAIAGIDEQLILSAGFDVRASTAGPSEPPAQPLSLAAAEGSHDAEIDLTWQPVAGAKSYVVEQSGDPVAPNTWAHAGVSTRASYTGKTLISGSRYWFRVAAVNAAGQSGWSDPATKIAP
jgi:hypothetical protein